MALRCGAEREADADARAHVPVRRGWRRRWLVHASQALDDWLGPRAIAERALFGELLAVDDVGEMGEVLNDWHVPSATLDLALGRACV